MTDQTPKQVVIFALAELDFSVMRMVNTQAEAEKLARDNKQDAYYLFPANHTYYVAVTK
jgi:hypothetical protein